MCRTSFVRNTCRAARATSLDKIGQPRANQSTFPLSFRTCSGTSFLSFRHSPLHSDKGGISPRHSGLDPEPPPLSFRAFLCHFDEGGIPLCHPELRLAACPHAAYAFKKPVFPLCLNPCILRLQNCQKLFLGGL